MDIKKLKNVFKNADKIAEGVMNRVFKKEHIEVMAEARMEICNECELLDTKGDACFAPGTQPCCSDCGCSLSFKTRSPSSACPKEKWRAVLTEEQEEKLNN